MEIIPFVSGLFFGIFSGISFKYAILDVEETIFSVFVNALCSISQVSCSNLLSSISLILLLLGILEILGYSEGSLSSIIFYFFGAILGFFVGVLL